MSRGKRNGIRFCVALLCLVALLVTIAPLAAAATAPYTVQAGDTLWKLANRYGTTVSELKVLNGLKSDYLFVGQKLSIPTAEAGLTTYYVQPGDTLYKLSLRFGTSVSELQRVNGLSSSALQVGQRLLIPASGSDTHTVQRGESLYLIAQRYGISISDLKQANNLTSDVIYAGQRLVIPGPSSAPAANIKLYRVASGDTLSEIARWFSTTANAIYATNRLHTTRLMPGQPLYIPVGSSTPVSVAGPRGSQKPDYGELLPWQDARWVFNPEARATIVDMYTGKSFQVFHLGGSNHADVEPVSTSDTNIMKSVFGQWSWAKRPVWVMIDGRKLAASLAGMPHDVEFIGNNGVAGHFDLYFLNSRSHNDNSLNQEHQQNVLRAAGQA